MAILLALTLFSCGDGNTPSAQSSTAPSLSVTPESSDISSSVPENEPSSEPNSESESETEREYASQIGVYHNAIHYRKEQILARLKKLLRN